MITNPDYIISDLAYDALMILHKRHAKIFERAWKVHGLRNLCREGQINPDAAIDPDQE